MICEAVSEEHNIIDLLLCMYSVDPQYSGKGRYAIVRVLISCTMCSSTNIPALLFMKEVAPFVYEDVRVRKSAG